jgi:hypothetical protein
MTKDDSCVETYAVKRCPYGRCDALVGSVQESPSMIRSLKAVIPERQHEILSPIADRRKICGLTVVLRLLIGRRLINVSSADWRLH